MKPIICVGAQKAGTSWLFRCLQQHKEVQAYPGKEIHFFSKHYDEKNIDQYLSLFAPDYPMSHYMPSIPFEASTSYLTDPDVPSRIAKHFPDARIIIMLRDPVERAFSAYLHYKNTGKLQDETIEEAIAKYPEIIEYSQYDEAVKRYYKHFKKVLLISFNRIATEPKRVLDEITDFAGIARFTPSTLHTKYHSSEARSSVWYKRFAHAYFFLRKTMLGRLLIRVCRVFGINHVLIDGLLREANTKPELSTADRKLLQNSISTQLS